MKAPDEHDLMGLNDEIQNVGKPLHRRPAEAMVGDRKDPGIV
jgi:hypothetical protein